MNKLWLLTPRNDLSGIDPWQPWYDKAFGFVIRAESEIEARQLADNQAGRENGFSWPGRHEWLDEASRDTSEDFHPWLDPTLSTCEVLLSDGETKVILRDFKSA
jgi:hypothetical protein